MSRRWLAVGVVVAVIAALVTAGPAQAAAKPSVAISTPATADTGQLYNVGYSGASLPAHSKLYLEQRVGGGKYVRVLALSGFRGAVRLKNASLGAYIYRVSDYVGSSLRVASAPHTIYVYGVVSFQHLCQLDTDQSWMYPLDPPSCPVAYDDLGTGQHFGYVTGYQDVDSGGADIGGVTTPTSCRSVNVQWGVSQEDGISAKAMIFQDGKYYSSPFAASGTVGVGAFRLSSHPWTFLLAINQQDNLDQVVANGWATCWTGTGVA